MSKIAFNGNWSGVYIPDAVLTNSFTLYVPGYHGIEGILYGYISDFDDDLSSPNTGLSVDSVNSLTMC